MATVRVNQAQKMIIDISKAKQNALITDSPDESLKNAKLELEAIAKAKGSWHMMAHKSASLEDTKKGSLEPLLHHLLGSSSSDEKCNQIQKYLSFDENNDVNAPDSYMGLIFGYEIGISRVEFFDWLTQKKCDYSQWKHVIAHFQAIGFPEVREFLSVIIKSPHTDDSYRGFTAVNQLHICDKYDSLYLVDNPLPSNFSPEPKLKKHSGKLRVAILSEKFATHIMSSQTVFQDMIFSGLPDDVEVWLFATKSYADKYTEAYRKKSHHFIDLSPLSIEESRAIIKEAEIDVVVDIVISTRAEYWELFEDSIRLGINHTSSFQKNYFHYIVDQKDRFPAWQKHFASLISTELYYFFPTPAATKINPSIPSTTNRYITFGVFSRLIKIHPINYDTWTTLLNEVPKSQIAFGFIQLNVTLQYIILQAFKQRGIDPDRITFFDMSAEEIHLTKYNTIDVVLDTFPVGSSFSLKDALWMGVPIVGLSRKMDHAGLTADTLKRLGKESWLANNEREYIDICKKLSKDRIYRKSLKSTLRQELLNSDLLDGEKYSKNIYDCIKELAKNNMR